MTKPLIYLIGSLRNPGIPALGDVLRKEGFEVFDEWHSAGERADDAFKDYCDGRGLTYKEALKTYAAKHIFEFDKRHITRSDIVILVMPAGKSGHLELGWALGQGKYGYVFFEDIPDRYDQMYQFANDIFLSKEELISELRLRHLRSGGTSGSVGPRVLGEPQQGGAHRFNALGVVRGSGSGEETFPIFQNSGSFPGS